MLNDKITVTKKHTDAAQYIIEEILPSVKPKFIIAIGGEVGIRQINPGLCPGPKIQETEHSQ
jgi:hypothetical protein